MLNLLEQLDIERTRNAEAWAIVTVDLETDEIVNVTGPFASPEQALVAAGEMDNAAKTYTADDELGWRHDVVPMWRPS